MQPAVNGMSIPAAADGRARCAAARAAVICRPGAADRWDASAGGGSGAASWPTGWILASMRKPQWDIADAAGDIVPRTTCATVTICLGPSLLAKPTGVDVAGSAPAV